MRRRRNEKDTSLSSFAFFPEKGCQAKRIDHTEKRISDLDTNPPLSTEKNNDGQHVKPLSPRNSVSDRKENPLSLSRESIKKKTNEKDFGLQEGQQKQQQQQQQQQQCFQSTMGLDLMRSKSVGSYNFSLDFSNLTSAMENDRRQQKQKLGDTCPGSPSSPKSYSPRNLSLSSSISLNNWFFPCKTTDRDCQKKSPSASSGFLTSRKSSRTLSHQISLREPSHSMKEYRKKFDDSDSSNSRSESRSSGRAEYYCNNKAAPPGRVNSFSFASPHFLSGSPRKETIPDFSYVVLYLKRGNTKKSRSGSPTHKNFDEQYKFHWHLFKDSKPFKKGTSLSHGLMESEINVHIGGSMFYDAKRNDGLIYQQVHSLDNIKIPSTFSSHSSHSSTTQTGSKTPDSVPSTFDTGKLFVNHLEECTQKASRAKLGE